MRTIEPLWIIEARDPASGRLDLRCPQPELVFGHIAITGMADHEIAKVIFRRMPDAALDGRFISQWPALLHPNWIARRKTW